MSNRLACLRAKHFSGFILLASTLFNSAGAATLEQETGTRLEQIRAIRPGQSAAMIATYNNELDATWQFLASHKPDVLPILREQLKAELARPRPSDLILLDVGFFLHENDSADGKALARDGLFRLNLRAAVIDENRKELFEFAHAAAKDHDPRVLGLIEREFLSSDQQIFIPQHALQLDGTLVCVFLYGAYGSDSERALRAKLRDSSVSKRVLELLVWLGSPGSVKEVGDALSASPNYETFSRVASFMMQAAGPAGREFMLNISPDGLDAQSRRYLSKVKSAIQNTSFRAIRNSFAGFPGDKQLSDAEVTSRLDAMLANFGKDDRTSPLAILDSGLGADFLISELLKIRERMLYRLSDEALSDVAVTNSLINALRYKGR